MTENEAKSFIQGKNDCMNKCDVFDCKNTDECDNCEFCYSQGNFGEQKKAFEMAIQAIEEIQQYRAIGTIEEFKALKEKNEPKKPIKHNSYYVCPCCGNTEIEYCNEVDCRTIRLKRCTLCEQKLDWSE